MILSTWQINNFLCNSFHPARLREEMQEKVWIVLFRMLTGSQCPHSLSLSPLQAV